MANFDNFVDEIKTKLTAAGLTYNTDPRDYSLNASSRGKFDGCFALYSVDGGHPWLEADLTPTHWRGDLIIEIGTEIKTSSLEADKLIEERARLFFRTIVYTQLTHGQIYSYDPPTRQRNLQDKRVIWSIRCKARWTDAT